MPGFGFVFSGAGVVVVVVAAPGSGAGAGAGEGEGGAGMKVQRGSEFVLRMGVRFLGGIGAGRRGGSGERKLWVWEG